MIYSTTKKYKDLHSIQRVKSVKIHVSASTALLEVIIEKKKQTTKKRLDPARWILSANFPG